MSRYLDIHILQSLPPNCLNRDGEGRPKTAVYGNAQRMRISSQAWKKAMRAEFRTTLDTNELGVRSREFADMIAERLVADPDRERLVQTALLIMDALGLPKDKDRPGCTSALQFFGEPQWRAIADVADHALGATDPEAYVKGEKARLRDLLEQDKAIDVAMFGRMAASEDKSAAESYSIHAASMVAHAIGVGRCDVETDFYTAVDENEAANGAGMVGETGFVNGVVYRYMNVNLRQLACNLAHDRQAERRALEAFIHASVMSMPTGKANSFAPRTRPSLVLTVIRDDYPDNLVPAFDDPVTGQNVIAKSIRLLIDRMIRDDQAFGTTPHGSWILLPDGAGEELAAKLEEAGTEIRPTLDTLIDTTVDAMLDGKETR